MSQTLEKAKQEYIEKHVSRNEYASFGEAFIAGAEWKEKQSPWISVKERLPETDNGQSLYEVIVVTGDKRFLVVINTEVELLIGLLGVTHWMSIPKINV